MSNRTLALELRLSGLTYDEIGKRLNVSRQRAQQLLRPPKAIYDEVKTRAKGKCQRCGRFVKSGHVHHKENCGEEFNAINSLQYLCIGCHRLIHPAPDGWRLKPKPKIRPHGNLNTIQRLMYDFNWSCEEVAVYIGVSARTIERWQKGQVKPQPGRRRELEKLLDKEKR